MVNVNHACCIIVIACMPVLFTAVDYCLWMSSPQVGLNVGLACALDEWSVVFVITHQHTWLSISMAIKAEAMDQWGLPIHESLGSGRGYRGDYKQGNIGSARR